MRSLVAWSLLVGLLASVCPARGLGQTAALARQRHPWGRFEPGAWKLVRVVAETFDEQGALIGTTAYETKTTLQKVDDDGVTLLVETVVEIGGKRLDAEPQVEKQGFRGELPGQQVKVTDGGPATVTVEGRQYPAQIEQTESIGPQTKTVTKTYYSTTVAPYALKSETITTDLQSGALLSQTEWQVVSLNVVCRVLRESKSSAHVKLTRKHAKGTTTTLAVTSVDIPGGIVCHSAKEFDSSGRLLRRSTLELVAYGVEPEEGRWGFWRRARPGHRHRAYRPTGR